MGEARGGSRDDGGVFVPHGGYRRLRSFQIARLVHDVTVRFCARYISKRSRTVDQMVQAARSGVQNIAEGSHFGGTSRKMEIKLTGVARGSLEELRPDDQDFLRQRGWAEWSWEDPRRRALVDRRCRTAEAVAAWVAEVRAAEVSRRGKNGPDGPETPPKSIPSTPPTPSIPPLEPSSVIAANAALVLIGVACALVERQLGAQGRAFVREGGFTEWLDRLRRRRREGRQD